MRHVLLTCKNHPNLRWGCKEIAFTEGKGYNGARSIFFWGEPTGQGMFEDGSGLYCSQFFPDRANPIVEECSCSPADLIRAPEDDMVARHD